MSKRSSNVAYERRSLHLGGESVQRQAERAEGGQVDDAERTAIVLEVSGESAEICFMQTSDEQMHLLTGETRPWPT